MFLSVSLVLISSSVFAAPFAVVGDFDQFWSEFVSKCQVQAHALCKADANGFDDPYTCIVALHKASHRKNRRAIPVLDGSDCDALFKKTAVEAAASSKKKN